MQKSLGLIAAAILAGCAAQPGPVTLPATAPQPQTVEWGSAKSVEIDLDEFQFQPDSLSFEVGRPYRVTFRNTGAGGHNFTSSELFSAVLLRPDAPGTAAAGKGQIELAPGASSTVELVPVTPGRYPFHCTHGMHELFGMSGEAQIR